VRAAGADLNRAAIKERKAAGEVCLDDGKYGVERHETAVGLGLESGCSVSSKPMKSEIVVEGAKRLQ
jgi:hypothetical protein